MEVVLMARTYLMHTSSKKQDGLYGVAIIDIGYFEVNARPRKMGIGHRGIHRGVEHEKNATAVGQLERLFQNAVGTFFKGFDELRIIGKVGKSGVPVRQLLFEGGGKALGKKDAVPRHFAEGTCDTPVVVFKKDFKLIGNVVLLRRKDLHKRKQEKRTAQKDGGKNEYIDVHTPLEAQEILILTPQKAIQLSMILEKLVKLHGCSMRSLNSLNMASSISSLGSFPPWLAIQRSKSAICSSQNFFSSSP